MFYSIRFIRAGQPINWKKLTGMLSAAFCLTLAPSVNAAPARPNILWIVSEDNNPFLGCYGDPLAHTPTLDKLSKEGITYDRCFAQPVCAPSRVALITGMFAVSCGPAEHMRASGKIPEWLTGFPVFLKKEGYYVTNNSKTDYNSPIIPADTWNESGKNAHYLKKTNPDQPFFSVFNHEVTHESCLFPEKGPELTIPPMDPAKVRIPPYQPDTPEIRADWARYYDCMSALDDQIASKLNDLEKAGLSEDTIIFYYGDNGGVLPRSKRCLQQSGTHVPLIVYYRFEQQSYSGTDYRIPDGTANFNSDWVNINQVTTPVSSGNYNNLTSTDPANPLVKGGFQGMVTTTTNGDSSVNYGFTPRITRAGTITSNTYLYCRIVLPMNLNFEFASISANLYST